MRLARQFSDVLGNGIAGKPGTEFREYRLTSGFINLKVSGSLHQIELMQVVRDDADIDQSLAELCQRVRIVIDPSQED